MTALPPTERRNPRSTRLDEMAAAEILALMDDEEAVALDAVRRARPALARAAEMATRAFTAGGTTAYVGAGTSGLLALLDAGEVSATFGVASERYRAVVATASVAGRAVVTASEDDVTSGAEALEQAGMGAGDLVIGIAASGTTPFVVAALEHARRLGSATVGIANNPATPVLEIADVAVLLDTGPEVLTGSTRLKAGTAQKLALNRISTAAMVGAGRVVSNHMVEVRPGPAKLAERCARIVQDLAEVDAVEARRLLVEHDWSIRAAVEAHRSPR